MILHPMSSKACRQPDGSYRVASLHEHGPGVVVHGLYDGTRAVSPHRWRVMELMKVHDHRAGGLVSGVVIAD